MRPNLKYIVVTLFLIASLIASAVEVFVGETEILSTVLEISDFLVSAILSYIWFVLDTNEKAFKRTPLWNTGIILLPIIFIPIYFFKSREPREAGKACFILALIVAALVGVIFAGDMLGNWLLGPESVTEA